MSEDMAGFRGRVSAIVSQIPHGRVMTYGQIAALCGNARAARVVGGIAHFGDPNLPWQRVVNRKGGMARGYYGGRKTQQRELESEGIVFDAEGHIADLQNVLWHPELS